MYCAVGAYAVAIEPSLVQITLPIVVAGLALHVVVLRYRTQELLAWGVACAAAAYVVAVVVHGSSVNGGAPLVGAGLLAACELAAWSHDERYRIKAAPGVVRQRATAVAALVIGGLVAGGLVLAFAIAPVGGGLVWTVLGAAAAVAVVAGAARVSR